MTKLYFSALEPRVLLDAAAVATVASEVSHHDQAETKHQTDAQKNAGSSSDAASQFDAVIANLSPETGTGRVLVVIDSRVEGAKDFAASLQGKADTLIVDSDESGAKAIADALASGTDVTGLHIISHGGDGSFTLGSDHIDTAALAGETGAEVSSWSSHLSAGADILLYGCNIAKDETGKQFVDTFSHLTGVDIAASDDVTGNGDLGGDWDLEYATGQITSALPADSSALHSISQLLADPVDPVTGHQPTISGMDGNQAVDGVEDTDVTLSGISVSDIDHDENNVGDTLTVTITVEDGSSNPTGAIKLNDISGLDSVTGDNSNTITLTGKQDAINAALNDMVLTPSENFNGLAKVKLTVDDGTTTAVTDSIDVAFSPVNDAPDLSPSPISVDEGGSVTIGQDIFNLVDPELGVSQKPSQEVFQVTSLPSDGVLKLNGHDLLVGSTFSLQDVIDGKLTYQHDGTDIIVGNNDSDGFKVTVNDGGGSGNVGPFDISVKIAPVNQAPTVDGSPKVYEGQGTEAVYNAPGTVTQAADIGSLLTISGGDADSSDDLANMSITISDVDNQGHGTLFIDTDGDGIFDSSKDQVISGSVTISGADIGKLKFAHNGSEPDGKSPSFKITVTDGGGGAGDAAKLSVSKTITIGVLGNDDNPEIDTNSPQTVDAGVVTTLSSDNLKVTDVDDASGGKQLVYKITALPTYGELRLNGVILGVGDRFSQDDLDHGRVTFFQTAKVTSADRVSGENYVADGFSFEVRDSQLRSYNASGAEGGVVDPATGDIKTNQFDFRITGDWTGDGGETPDGDVTIKGTPVNSGLQVTEEDGVKGGVDTGTITSSLLNYILQATSDGKTYDIAASDTVYRLTDLPTNGKLYLNNVELHAFDSFTQADIDANNVVFVHDGSEDHQSSFGFSLSVGVTEIVKTTFSLRAIAANDAPTVSDGTATVAEGGTVGLTTSALGMNDVDTSNEPGEPADANDEAQPDDLYIQITSLPQNGTLQYLSNGNWIDIQTGDWISAKLLTGDANTTGIRYVQTVESVSSDSFEYRVRDDFKDDSSTDSDNVRSGVSDPTANHVSGTASVNLTITSVDNHAPTITGSPKAYEGQGSENLYNDNTTKTQAADIGGQITIGDFDSYDDESRLTVSITNVDTHGVGTLFLDADGDGHFGTGDTEITGDTSDLTIAEFKTLKFIHDGAEPRDATDPSFTVTVTDSGGGFGTDKALSTSKNIVIDIQANDDYSWLDTNRTAQIDAGESFVIDTSYLSVSDVDTINDALLVYEVTDLPDHGELRLDGVRLTVGDRFSQVDLAAGKLIYVQNRGVDDPDAKADGTAFTADSFNFKVFDSQQRVFNKDGAEGGVVDPNNNHEIAVNTFNIEIQGDFAGDGGDAQPSEPATVVTSTNNGIDVTEGDGVMGGSDGDTHTLSNGELSYQLKYTQDGSEYTVAANATVYRISELPTNGTLYLDGKAIDSRFDSFTQDDIDNGRVVFVHNGGEIHQGSFDFTISVGTSKVVDGSFALRATATNDAPTATGGTLGNVTRGATVGVIKRAFGMDDADVANESGEPGNNPEASKDDLFFKVTDLPDGGKLQYYDGDSSSWVDVTGTDWLSVDLLTNSDGSTKLRYVNTDTAATTDSFKFIVRDDLKAADGVKQSASDPASDHASAEKQVSWNLVAAVNHAPTIDGTPSVYEGQGTEDVYNNPGTKTSAADIGGQITIADTDASDSGNLTIEISNINTHGLGTLFLDANGDGQVGSGEEITASSMTLTMAEFKTLKFAHNGTEPDGTKPEFTLKVTDKGGEPGAGHELTTTKTVQIDVIANDDHSVLDTNKPTTVQAGVSTVITRNFLHVSDVDDTSNGTEIIYRLTSLPTYGELRLNGNLMTVNSTFTQADLDAGKVTYVQTKAVTDSDGTTAGTAFTADSFNFQVTDSHTRVFNNAGQAGGVVDPADGSIATNTFHLQIQGSYDPDKTPTSDPVVIDQSSVNSGIEVYEGDGQRGGTDKDTVTISSDNLSYTLKAKQGDSSYTIPAEATVYRLTSLPQNGTLYLDGKVLGRYDSFTQADINNGLLQFTHDGGETHHGSFNFSISIGTGDLADKRAQGTFTITAIPVNDAPTASGGSVPTIGEGATVTITTGSMKMADVDNQNEPDEPYGEAVVDDLYFQVVDLPDNGTLQYKDGDGNWVDVSAGDWLSKSLLTGDKNTSKLRYIHDGTENFTDSFQYRVRDDLHDADGIKQTAGEPAANNTSNTATVTFTIAPLNDAPISDENAAADTHTEANGRTTVNQVLEVAEGGSGTISDSYLVSVDPDNTPDTLQYRITSNVTSGTLYLNGKRLGVGSVFTQADIDAGRLTYSHDGSEVRADNFKYIVSDSVSDHTWTVGGTKAASQFDIVVPADKYANDIPTISRAGADYDVYGTNTFDMKDKFTVGDPDLVVVDSPGETDFVSVTVLLKDKDGNAVDLGSSGDLRLDTTTGITVTSDDASTGSITFQGKLADVQAALDGMKVVLPDGDHDTTYTVDVSVDDRLRDSSGALTTGANGADNATVNQDGSTIDDVNNIVTTSILLRSSLANTPPTIDVPNPGDARITYEDTSKNFTGIRIGDADAFGKDVKVTLSVDHGTVSFSYSGDVEVRPNDDNTSVVLTGSVDAINAIMDRLAYSGNQNYVGPDVLHISVDDLGNSGGDAQTVSTTVDITVKSVNDAPTITNGTPDRIDVVNNDTYTFGDASNGFVIDDIDLNGGDGEDAFVVTVRILAPNGSPLAKSDYTTGSHNIVIGSTDTSGKVTVDGTYGGDGSALRISGTKADINNYLKGLQVNFGDFGEQNKTYKLQVIVDDRMPGANGTLEDTDMANGGPNPDQTPYDSAPNINATEINPYSTKFSDSGFQYNVAAVTREVFLTAYNTPAKVTGTDFHVPESNGVIKVDSGNANLNINDVDDLGGTMSVTLTLSNGTFTKIGSYSGDDTSGGKKVDFADDNKSIVLTGFTEAELNSLIKDITVKAPAATGDSASNSNFNGDITLTVVVNDLGNSGLRPDSLTGDTDNAAANPGDYAYADGSSAELITTRTITITVDPTNDTPTISAGTTSHSITESDVLGEGTPATTILDNVTIGDVDLATTGGLDANTFGKGQIVVHLTSAQSGEVLSVANMDGIDTITGGTNGSDLKINLTDSATLDQVKAIVEAIKYQSNGDIVSGTRDISVKLYDAQASSQHGNIQSGGGDAGASRKVATINATVEVTEKNDPPSISGTPAVTAKEDIDYVFKVDDFNFSQPGDESSLDTALNKITVKSLPDNDRGKLMLQTGTDGDGAPVYSDVTVGQDISADDIAAGKLIYRSETNLNQSDAATSFTYSVWDKGHASDTTIRESANGTMQITVDPQNDAPVLTATDTTASSTESSTSDTGTDPVQIVSGVSLTDIDLSTTDGLSNFGKGTLTVEIVGASASTKEYLTFKDTYTLPDGVTVVDSAGNPITPSDTVGDHKLVFSLDADTTAAEVQTLMENLRYHTNSDVLSGDRTVKFTINDGNNEQTNGNTAGGPSALEAVLNATVTITEVNDPPIGGDKTVTTDEDTDYIVKVADFDYSQPGDETDTFKAVRIDSLPASGKGTLYLKDSGGTLQAVSVNDVISASDIANEKLVFRPAENVNGDAATSFTFTVQDSRDGYATSSNTMTVNIEPRNDAPTFNDTTGVETSVDESTAANTGTTPVAIITGANIGDIDLSTTDALSSTVYGAGKITVSVGSATISDQLTLAADDRPAGVKVTGGNNGNALVITLNADTTRAQVNAILNAIKYASTSDTASGERVITTTLSDGQASNDGGNAQAGGDAGGPNPLSVDLVSKITIVEKNDPPASSDNTVTTKEDTSYVIKPADFKYTQPGGETDTMGGVTINSITGAGTLKLDGTAITTPQFVSYADIDAGKLVYEPVANDNGDAKAKFTFTVRDSRGLDATSSSDLTVNVTPQNDAPSFNDSKAVETSVNESTDANKGVPATAIITDANIDDIDLSTTGGLDSGTFGAGKITVAITGADSSEQLTIDTDALTGKALPSGVVVSGGVNGADLVITLDGNTTRAEVNQILNAIRYSTNSDTFSGGERTITTTLSDGNNVQAAKVGSGDVDAGGPNPLTATLVSKITVVEKNDPPQGADQTVTTSEDTDYALKVADFNYSQPGDETDTFKAVRIDSLPASGKGTLYLKDSGGTLQAVSVNDVISASDIANEKLVFRPAENVNGDAATSFTFTVQDSRDGYATSSNTMTVNIEPRNDAPTFNDTTGVETSVDESTAANTGTTPVAIITGANIGDIDLSTTDALSSTVYGAGKITVSVGSATISDQLTLAADDRPAGVKVTGGNNGNALVITLNADTTRAQVNAILNAIKYASTSDTASGERVITTTLSDGHASNDGGNAQAGGDAGGPNPLSVDLVSKITIVEKNDPPASSDNTVTTKEDTSYVIKPADFKYTQPGGETDTLGGVTINSITGAGTLKLDGTAITTPQFVSYADIDAGKLVYEPVANDNGDAKAKFTFTVRDSRGLDATSSSDLTVNVTPQNDAPSFNDSKAVETSVNESTDANKGVPATAIITDANIGDIDLSTTGGLDSDTFGEGKITVAITGADSSEQLTIDTDALTGKALPSGVVVSGGVNGADLVITLDGNTTRAEVNQILNAIRYSTNSDTFTGGERTITTTLSDGKASSDDGNAQAGGNAGGPDALSAQLISKITVVEKNDPPLGADQTVTTLEDTDYKLKVTDFNYSQPGGEKDTFKAVRIDTLPDSGTLKLNGTAISAGTVVSVADITSGKLVYSPAENVNGDAVTTFTFSVQDSRDGFDTTPKTVTVNVTPQNDAPSFNDSKAVETSVNESTDANKGVPATAIITDANIGDIDLSTTGGLDSDTFGEGKITVAITGADSSEQLTIDTDALTGKALPSGVVVSGGVNGADLVITLDGNTTRAEVNQILNAIRYSTNSDTFTGGERTITTTLSDGKVSSDDGNAQAGGNAGGPDALSAQLISKITVVEKNDPPLGADQTVTTLEDTDYKLKVTDFNYSQPGGEKDTFKAVRIDTLPDSGTLKLNGTAVTKGQVVSVADITDGKLVYSPAENVNGDAVTTFTFSVQDSRDGFDITPKTVTVNVTPQNDAPSFNDSKAVVTSVNESTDANKGVPATAIITDANIGDIDLSTTGGLDSGTFGEGKITVAITGADSSEQLTIDTDALTGKALPSGVVVSGGVNGADLVITLDGNTTRTEVNQILNAIRYSTNSDTFTGGERTITTTLSDGKVSTDDGNVQAGGDAGGPDALSAQLISKITVVEKNDPPLGADQTVTTLEDTDYKLKVTDFNYSQPGGEKDTFKAVRIDTLPDSGTLKLNGTAISAGTVVSVADITSGKLVYSPAENVNGDAVTTFTFSVQDSRDGFDTTPKTVTVNVTPQNDAPSFNDSKAVTTSVNESTDANKGVPATAIITGANIGDIDLSTTGALSSTVYGEGTITVAITGADASEQLTIDSSALPAGVTQTGGVNGSNLVITLDANTTVAEVNAILDAIRYSTTSDTFTGGERTITTTLSDGKVSTNDGNVQAGGDAGGPNALSVDLVSKITVVEKNDPPVISGSPAVTATEDTDYAFKLGDFHYEQKGGESTVDTDLNKITVKSLPDSTKGKLLLQTGTSGGSPVYTEVAVGQDISAADITAGKLIYRADANLNGPEAKTSFTYSVWDKGHAASSNVPAESATGTMDISVTPVNDAPVLSGTSKSPAMVIKDDGTGTTGTAALASGVSVSDIDITTDADVSSYGGGTIIVSFTEGYQSGDRLSVNGGMLAGMAGVTGGNGSALVISLTNDATSAQVKSIIEAIRYGSVDADPTANKTDTTRAYSIVLNDGDNNADGGAIDGVKDAGGPTSLNSAALTGTITFRYPPTATDDTVTVSKDSTTGTGNVKTNDSDPEHTADPTHEADFTVTEVNSATGNVGKTITGTYGTITINADGTYSYKLDPTNTAVIQQLPGDAPLTESFTYQITDNDGQTDTATLHIKILGHNEPPEATDNSNSVKVGNNETATGNVISDNDGHGVDSNTENTSQTLSVVGINGATGNIGTPVTITYGTITVNSDGTYRYVLNTGNSAVRNLPVGQTLTETFTYTLSDGIDTDVATVTITIDGPNASKPPSPPPTPGTGPGPGDPPGSPDPGPGGTPGPGNDPFTRVENSFGSKVDFRSPLNNPVRLTLELQDRVATASGIQLFPVPATAFQHTDPTETLDIEASQPDGSPLPSYVNFNAQNLVFVVDGDAARVAGAKSIDIRVTGRDTRGNEATTTFTILFTDRNIDGQDGKAGENAPDKQDGEKDQGNPDNVNPDNGNPDNGNAPDTGEAPATSGNDRAEAPISDRDALAGMAAKERMLSRIAVDAQAMNFGRHAILAEREALLADFAALFRG